MRKLINGIHEFERAVFAENKALFEQLAEGQHPLALLITCSDSRIDPNLLTQTQPGELFVLRNAGNIVPPYDAAKTGEAATIEYAVAVLKVKDIIICGHSFCGAMGAVLQPESLAELPAVKEWLSHAEATAQIVEQKCADGADEQQRLKTAVEENVLVQLENLRTHPTVNAAVAAGELELHGWTYHFETGQVLAHNSQQGRFLPLP